MKKYVMHGKRYTKAYSTWSEMLSRCYNKNKRSYRWYGAIGITVCDRWKNNFENFYLDMGDPPEGMSIDRIDPKKGYSPENCRWATQKQQTENRTCQKFYEHDGLKLTLPEWSKRLGIKYRTLNSRLKRTGMSFADAINHKYKEITESGMQKLKAAVIESNVRRGRYINDKSVSGVKP